METNQPIQVVFDNLCRLHFGDYYNANQIFNLVEHDIYRRNQVHWNSLTNGRFNQCSIVKVKDQKVPKQKSIEEKKIVLEPLTFGDDNF